MRSKRSSNLNSLQVSPRSNFTAFSSFQNLRSPICTCNSLKKSCLLVGDDKSAYENDMKISKNENIFHLLSISSNWYHQSPKVYLELN